MRISILAMLMIRLIGPMIFCSGADALTIAWGDLKNTVANRPVAVEVEKIKILRGTILEQDEAGLRLAIESTKPSGLHKPFDNVRIERRAITRFQVVKDPKRTSGRWIGGIAGYFGGGALGVAAGGGEQDPRILLGLLLGSIAGYYTGKSFDKALLEITFLDASVDWREAERQRKALLKPSPDGPASGESTRRIPYYLTR